MYSNTSSDQQHQEPVDEDEDRQSGNELSQLDTPSHDDGRHHPVQHITSSTSTATTTHVPTASSPTSSPTHSFVTPHPLDSPSRPTPALPAESSSTAAASSSSTSAAPTTTFDSSAVPTPQHIPRSANSFILFRSHLIKTGAIPTNVEGRPKTISKIIGSVWRNLPADERAYWENKAEEEKVEHRRLYPDWRFAPGIQQGDVSQSKKTKKKRKNKKRKRESDDDEPSQASRSPAISSSDAKGKGKEVTVKEERPSPSPVVYDQSLPTPYTFSIPLGSPPSDITTAIPENRSGKGKALSLPVPSPVDDPRRPTKRRATYQSPSTSSSGYFPSQIAQSSSSSSMGSHTQSHTSETCHFTGHELEPDVGPASSSSYQELGYGLPSLGASSTQPQGSYFDPPHRGYYSSGRHASSSGVGPIRTGRHPATSAREAYHQSSHAGPSSASVSRRFDPRNFQRTTSPLAYDLDMSRAYVPLTHMYRRPPSADPRSPPAPHHSEPGSSRMPFMTEAEWAHFGVSEYDLYAGTFPSTPSLDSSAAAGSPTLPGDLTFGGAVTGGQPIDTGFSPSASSPVPLHAPGPRSPTDPSTAAFMESLFAAGPSQFAAGGGEDEALGGQEGGSSSSSTQPRQFPSSHQHGSPRHPF